MLMAGVRRAAGQPRRHTVPPPRFSGLLAAMASSDPVAAHFLVGWPRGMDQIPPCRPDLAIAEGARQRAASALAAILALRG
ncbi:hypothetical protein SAMN06295912_102222 [Sphingomonas laterariae]|uniref:Uncharacterized protein n=1 Tax=Edaphosphingomonas laterariae TaxID=861865 RepID=A0A239CK56_9SPHN|nr:hypothetical protein SAMN06295912_102222 [Sphingomonas laterariae]